MVTKKMARNLLLAVLLVHSFDLCESQGRYWLKSPGTVYACPGDDVSFLWHYDPQIADVFMIYWKFLGNGQTVAGHHFVPVDKVIFYHSSYENRVSVYDRVDVNAGILLKDVTASDAGDYKVELFQSGLSDVATLKVIEESDLITKVTVDGEEVVPGATLNKYGAQNVQIKVETRSVVNGTIVLSYCGQRSTACVNQASCSVTFDLSSGSEDVSETVLPLTASVYYGACQPQEQIFYIDTAIKATTSGDLDDGGKTVYPQQRSGLHPGTITAIVLGVLLFLFIAIVLILWGVFYRKQSTGYALEPWQRKYYNNKVFKPLRACRKDPTRNEPRRVPISLGPKPAMNESSRSLNKPLNRTLTVEDITVVREPEVPKEDSLDGQEPSTDAMITKDSEFTEFDDTVDTDSDFDTRHDQSEADHDMSDPRVKSLQYSELDDTGNSMSKFV